MKRSKGSKIYKTYTEEGPKAKTKKGVENKSFRALKHKKASYKRVIQDMIDTSPRRTGPFQPLKRERHIFENNFVPLLPNLPQ